MSQAGILNIAGGGGGGSPVQTLTGDSGGAVPPTANNINVLADDSRINNDNGITVIGTPGTSTVTVTTTNRLTQISPVTTTNATPTPLITFVPTVIGTYAIEARVAAYNTTATLGAGYSIFGTARYDGVSYNLVGTLDRITNEEGAMTAANVTMSVSGAGILINAVGYAANTINWSAVGLYTFVGV